mmetsp:Transcript_10797/g.26472  ORF Transcript_10797/g.26472 Transcript_10797/m.26472 type:complete len:231 (-) Transcript_10797:1467-2159(-)
MYAESGAFGLSRSPAAVSSPGLLSPSAAPASGAVPAARSTGPLLAEALAFASFSAAVLEIGSTPMGSISETGGMSSVSATDISSMLCFSFSETGAVIFRTRSTLRRIISVLGEYLPCRTGWSLAACVGLAVSSSASLYFRSVFVCSTSFSPTVALLFVSSDVPPILCAMPLSFALNLFFTAKPTLPAARGVSIINPASKSSSASCASAASSGPTLGKGIHGSSDPPSTWL